MNSYKVAKWLNSECTDEEFVQTFTYLYLMMTGRKQEKGVNDQMVYDMFNHSNQLFAKLEDIFNKIVFKNER